MQLPALDSDDTTIVSASLMHTYSILVVSHLVFDPTKHSFKW